MVVVVAVFWAVRYVAAPLSLQDIINLLNDSVWVLLLALYTYFYKENFQQEKERGDLCEKIPYSSNTSSYGIVCQRSAEERKARSSKERDNASNYDGC